MRYLQRLLLTGLAITNMILAIGFASLFFHSPTLVACCPAPRLGERLVNADQSVIMIWDPVEKVQHFIRKATFVGQSQDFGFIIPTPTQPELSESGGTAFDYLADLTKPEIQYQKRPAPGVSCGCALQEKTAMIAAPNRAGAVVLARKNVAGFDAVVLKADTSDDLVQWLQVNEFAYSDAIKAWAQPYIDQKWNFTALKFASKESADEKSDATSDSVIGTAKTQVQADTLRLTFKTDRPLFPYREPATNTEAAELNQNERTLKIYFLADKKFQGNLEADYSWSGVTNWAGELSDEAKTKLLSSLNLPTETGPDKFYLTEFTDNWAYDIAPSDVYFAESEDQSIVRRPPQIIYTTSLLPTDPAVYAIAAVLILPIMLKRKKK